MFFCIDIITTLAYLNNKSCDNLQSQNCYEMYYATETQFALLGNYSIRDMEQVGFRGLVMYKDVGSHGRGFQIHNVTQLW